MLSKTAATLQAADIAPESLAEYVPARRVMLIKRAATMRPLGTAWHIGTLLIGLPEPVPALWAAGQTTRATNRLHPSNQSVSREERRDIAAAAIEGGYAQGTSVNFNATPIALDEPSLRSLGPTSPIGIVQDEIRVRWRAGAPLDTAPTLERYLAERISLLIEGRNPA